jgi:phosphatidylserine/phosphatidylglycerophosphate/cardiolipin synthase-like enzyme
MKPQSAPGLSRVPLSALERLAAEVDAHRLACPIREVELRAAGFGAMAGHLAAGLERLERDAVLAALRLVIAERQQHQGPKLTLVWTGPEARASVARDTAHVVRSLFAGARRSVIVGGYAFDDPSLLAPLHTAMAVHRFRARLFLDVRGEAETEAGAEAIAREHVERFFRKVWPFGRPHPEVYYDPRTPRRGPPWASLHAKCVVVDDERALVTSANFTGRGTGRNIEVGVLVEGATFAEELAAQWRQLITAGLVRTCATDALRSLRRAKR